MAVEIEIADDVVDHRLVDIPHLFGVGRQQDEIADDVDQTGDAAAVHEDKIEGLGFEAQRLAVPRHLQAVQDVLLDFLAVQGLQVALDADALPQLAQFRLGQQGAQLRLPHQDDLQQLGVARFQVGEHPDLFQGFQGEVLRLVDDQ